MASLRKIGVVKIVHPRIKLGVQGTSDIEFALVKPLEYLNFFAY
jgi:hypothetical protein